MNIQSLATDQFFYFVLRPRKEQIRRTVQVLQSRYPDEAPAELAQRLIESKATLSLVGSTLLRLPLLFPGVGQALKLLGVVSAASLLTRMHLYLILEIAAPAPGRRCPCRTPAGVPVGAFHPWWPDNGR